MTTPMSFHPPIHESAETWDVLVVGGGPAGCAAAAAAGRAGVRTLLVEATGSLGGMGTSGLLNQWMSFSNWNEFVVRGLAQEIHARCKAGLPHAPPIDLQPIDTELLKRVYDDLLAEHGVTVRFNTRLAAVQTNGKGRVLAAVLADKSGLHAERAQSFVDGTGDGDLAAWAGAEFQRGDSTGELMPASLCFTLANVDLFALQHGPALHPVIIDRIVASGKYPDIPDRFIVPVVIGPGIVGCNAGHIWGVDPADGEAYARAMREGRRIARAFRDALAEFHPAAFGNAFLVATAPQLGVRETRRIVGEATLTLDDYRARRSFPDEICRNSYCIDVHPQKAAAKADARGQAPEPELPAQPYKPGESHGIPFGALVPRNLTNVLVAGRCISSDRDVNGAIRIMPVCLGTGEAAGTAAALAAAHQGDVRAVPVEQLIAALKANGAYLPGAADAHPAVPSCGPRGRGPSPGISRASILILCAWAASLGLVRDALASRTIEDLNVAPTATGFGYFGKAPSGTYPVSNLVDRGSTAHNNGGALSTSGARWSATNEASPYLTWDRERSVRYLRVSQDNTANREITNVIVHTLSSGGNPATDGDWIVRTNFTTLNGVSQVDVNLGVTYSTRGLRLTFQHQLANPDLFIGEVEVYGETLLQTNRLHGSLADILVAPIGGGWTASSTVAGTAPSFAGMFGDRWLSSNTVDNPGTFFTNERTFSGSGAKLNHIFVGFGVNDAATTPTNWTLQVDQGAGFVDVDTFTTRKAYAYYSFETRTGVQKLRVKVDEAVVGAGARIRICFSQTFYLEPAPGGTIILVK